MDDHAGEAELKCFSDGRVVQTLDGGHPDTAAAAKGSGRVPIREAQSFIRRNTSRPKNRSTAWDEGRA